MSYSVLVDGQRTIRPGEEGNLPVSESELVKELRLEYPGASIHFSNEGCCKVVDNDVKNIKVERDGMQIRRVFLSDDPIEGLSFWVISGSRHDGAAISHAPASPYLANGMYGMVNVLTKRPIVATFLDGMTVSIPYNSDMTGVLLAEQVAIKSGLIPEILEFKKIDSKESLSAELTLEEQSVVSGERLDVVFKGVSPSMAVPGAAADNDLYVFFHAPSTRNAADSQVIMLTIPFQASDTVSNLKAKISSIDATLTASMQYLTYGGKYLKDGSRSLSKYGIEKNSGLYLVDPRVQIFVNTLTPKTYTFDMSTLDTVMSLKTKISAGDGTAYDSQRIIFEGRELEDYRTLAHCNIRSFKDAKYRTLYLTLRIRSGRYYETSARIDERDMSAARRITGDGKIPLKVVLPDCTSILLKVGADESIENVKQRLKLLLSQSQGQGTAEELAAMDVSKMGDGDEGVLKEMLLRV